MEFIKVRILLSDEEKQFIWDNVGKMTQKEMAEYIGCSHTAIYYNLKKKGLSSIRWSESKCTKFIEMYNSHVPLRKIAKEFNVNVHNVYTRASILRSKGFVLEDRKHNRYK